MPVLFGYLFPAMWFGWMAYWLLSSRRVKRTEHQESLSSRLSYNGLLILAGIIFTVPALLPDVFRERFLPQSLWVYWLAVALTAAGLSFSVWARAHLGKNWSAMVTIKRGHELVTSGPYALARHPIYTGVLLALAGSTIAIGDWRAILAYALAATSLWRKLRVEERWMCKHFGDTYVAYSKRVSALIPYVL